MKEKELDKNKEEIKIKNSEMKENRREDIEDLFKTFERTEKNIRYKYRIFFLLLYLGLLFFFMFIFSLLIPFQNILIHFFGKNIYQIIFCYMPLPLMAFGALGIYKIGSPWKWGGVEKRFLLYSYGTYHYRFEEISKKYLHKFIEELEGELDYAKEMLFFGKDSEKTMKEIIDNLEKYILPNLGKEDLTEDEKSEIIRIFKHFSFKMFDIIRKENKKTEKEKQDILILLSGINKEKKLEKLFGHKEIHKKILEKIYFKLNRIVLSKSFSLAITLLIWFGFVLISWYYDKWQIFGTLTSFGFIYLFLREITKKT